ncbi:FliH/SctL family protein [Desulfogranum japonicum]|uniref:FliH/SctL family protein n=1 Tax=Desulfogranum japonicum TaxID=231447 RepID=UPI000404585D|nr:FliH/SctL family protein [Desulfogranum japonicum]
MSSSKIFPKDDFFQPTNLVQEEIAAMFPEEMEGEQPAIIEEAEPSLTEGFTEEFEETDTGSPQVSEPLETADPPSLSVEEEPAAPPIDVEAIKEEAYNQGVADAMQQCHNQFDTTLQALELASQKIDTLRSKILVQCREEIINTTIQLTHKIVAQEIATGRDLIAHTVEMAIDKAIESDEFVIRLHPDDLQTVEEMRPELLNKMSSLNHILIKKDNTIERGGCILDSKTCLVDATVAAQLEKAKQFLLEHTAPITEPVDDTTESSQ